MEMEKKYDYQKPFIYNAFYYLTNIIQYTILCEVDEKCGGSIKSDIITCLDRIYRICYNLDR